jgi:hypothetical protein
MQKLKLLLCDTIQVMYKSYTDARGGMGARIMRTGARIRTHARAYLPQSVVVQGLRAWRG